MCFFCLHASIECERQSDLQNPVFGHLWEVLIDLSESNQVDLLVLVLFVSCLFACSRVVDTQASCKTILISTSKTLYDPSPSPVSCAAVVMDEVYLFSNDGTDFLFLFLAVPGHKEKSYPIATLPHNLGLTEGASWENSNFSNPIVSSTFGNVFDALSFICKLGASGETGRFQSNRQSSVRLWLTKNLYQPRSWPVPGQPYLSGCWPVEEYGTHQRLQIHPLQEKQPTNNSQQKSTSYCLPMLVLLQSFHYKCSELGFRTFLCQS